MPEKFHKPPVDILHMPTLHDGVFYADGAPDWIVRPGQTSRVRMFAASDHDQLRMKQKNMLARQAHKRPDLAIEINSSPVVLENARFAQGISKVNGRFWLNGASGGRVRSKFKARNTEEWRMQRHYGAYIRSRNNGKAGIPEYAGSDLSDLPVAIELRNGYNYYHFSTETLGSLIHFVDDSSDQPIRLHLGNSDVKGFINGFIRAIYPSLAHRVKLEKTPTKYGKVRSVYSHQHYLYAANDPKIENALFDSGLHSMWYDFLRNPKLVSQVAIQSYDANLRRLREHALSRVQAEKVSLPLKFIWVERDEGNIARDRGLTGHEALLEELMALGFEKVIFEHLTPLEQIAAMNSADIVVAPHGAGLSNMIYAKPGALVIEIGTRQTQLHRWGDFVKCAHVSKCNYDTVFADISGFEGTGEVPSISKGHFGVHVGKLATDQIISLVKAHIEEMAGT